MRYYKLFYITLILLFSHFGVSYSADKQAALTSKKIKCELCDLRYEG